MLLKNYTMNKKIIPLFYSILIFSFLLNSSCKENKPKTKNNNNIYNKTNFTYIFLGHIYDAYGQGKRVDSRVEHINFKNYDQIWLGGDLCTETTANISTLEYLNNLFDLSNKRTIWTLGNHDVRNGHHDWIRAFTGRELFYAQYLDNITIFNLSTSLFNPLSPDSSLVNIQYNLLKKVCDTITNDSKALILLMHNVVWDSVSTDFDASVFANTNDYIWKARLNPDGYFYSSIYPMLCNVRNKGIKVFCISGDVGQKDIREFQYLSNEGIWFLGAGISNSLITNPEVLATMPDDKVLIFYNSPSGFSWQFKTLDFLIN